VRVLNYGWCRPPRGRCRAPGPRGATPGAAARGRGPGPRRRRWGQRVGCCGGGSPHSAVNDDRIPQAEPSWAPARDPRSARSGQTPKGIAVDVRSGGHAYPSPPAKSPVPFGWLPYRTRWVHSARPSGSRCPTLGRPRWRPAVANGVSVFAAAIAGGQSIRIGEQDESGTSKPVHQSHSASLTVTPWRRPAA